MKFGRYLLLDRIAAGGMAEVWRAKTFGAEGFQRIVAIKKILPHVAEDNDFITMFKDEAKITVLLQHANVGQVYELGLVDDTYYIAMEYIPGKDVKTLWQHQRHQKLPLPIPLTCYIVQNMAEGLDYAHRKKDNFGVDLKIVHRDVSPQNILVSWEGEVKVIDFGIAKAAGKASKTQAGILKGKFGYMAPEQVRGLPIDQRSDVFAIGVVLYELLTGQRAFKAESDFSLLEMVRNVELTPPTIVNKDIPDELEKIVFKALAKEADDRYHWASELSQALQRFMLLNGEPATRMDMGKYLRENFTVDYDRERLRMETYREIEMPKDPEPVVEQATQVQAPALPDRGNEAVMAAMAAEGGAIPMDTGTFAPPTQSGTGTHSNVYVQTPPRESSQPQVAPDPTGARRPPSGPAIRPPLRVTNPQGQAKKQGSLLKYVGVTVAALLLTVGVGLGLSIVLMGKGSVLISSRPHDVRILLDGVVVGRTKDGSLTIQDIKAGSHDLAAQKAGYLPYNGKINVGKNTAINVPVTLEKMPDPVGSIDVTSEPAGAHIWVNGRDTGKVTPGVIDNVVAADKVRVELKLPDYKVFEKIISVEADKATAIEAKLPSRFVNVQIDSLPSGASLYLNGKLLGKTPFTVEHINPDNAPPVLEIKRRGCKTYETRLAVNEGDENLHETFTLKCR